MGASKDSPFYSNTMIDFEIWEALRAGHSAKPKERVSRFYISPGDGNGDLLYNTCREIIDRNEQGIWPNHSIEFVFLCLSEGMRWPDYMVEHIPAAQWRDQYDMTQDPWIMAYCCAVHLNRIDLIQRYKPSVKIFNLPDKWAWRRALLGKWNTWWIWRRIIPFNWLQNFVYVFYGYMEKAYGKET